MDEDHSTQIDWTKELTRQLEWHWAAQLRPRLDGLTEEEYFWEPVRGCWTLRRRQHRPPTAKEALDQLDQAHAAWIAGVRSIGDEGLARCIGEGKGLDADYPFAALVLHINREVIHYGAEIALLRDLYACRGDRDHL